MKSSGAILVALFGFCCSAADGVHVAENPLGTVIKLLRDLSAKVREDADTETNTYRKFKAWCDETENAAHFQLDTEQRQHNKLQAVVQKLSSDFDEADTKIEELVSAIAEAESQSKTAKEVRNKERQNFIRGQKDLMDMIPPLEQAIGVLEKSPAALAQVKTTGMANIETALRTLLEAASFSTSDRNKLIALVQSRSVDAEDADEAADIAALGAPQAATYNQKSGGILEVLEDMKDKAETQLQNLRKAELEAQNQYALLKQSLEARLAEDNKEKQAATEAKSKARELKAEAEGDLQLASKDLTVSKKEHDTIQTTCVDTAADHEQTRASRDQEIKTLAEATDILRSSAQSASSFLQVASAATSAATSATTSTSSRSRVVTEVRRLAKELHSTSLAQLASRIVSVMERGASSGSDPFHKVKELIKDLIYNIESKMNKEAKEKAFCQEQLKKVGLKEEDLSEVVAGLKANIETDEAKLGQLEETINALDSDVASIEKQQYNLHAIRKEQKEEYKSAKADLEEGLNGVRHALRKLKDFYQGDEASTAMLQQGGDFPAFLQQPAKPESHEKASGAGGNIIELLEAIEQEMAHDVAKLESVESGQQADYEKMSAENEIVKVSKSKEETYKETSQKSVRTELSEVSTDKDSTSTELDAVDQYLHKLKDRCQAKPDKYKERAAKRAETIKGLKHALTILKNEARDGFLQRRSALRGLPSVDMAAEP